MNTLWWVLLLAVEAEEQAAPATAIAPDAEVLLFLAEWSDENDQWVDPDLFAENPVHTSLTENRKAKQEKDDEDEQDPDID